MATLADRIASISDLSREECEYLRALCSSWQVLADLSFSDLLLYVRRSGEEEVFEIAAQLRPFTSQTLYPEDMVGTVVGQPEQPMVERVFREGAIWAQDDPVLVDGIPIQMGAVPVGLQGKVIGVITKEGSPATFRRLGRLEEVYLEAATSVSQMIRDGAFPFPNTSGDWPRVGDGLIVLDDSARVTWASPNALSSLSRLDANQNIIGRPVVELGFTDIPERALRSRRLMDGEVRSNDTDIQIRVLPFLSGERASGAAVLCRDVSELRRKERMISVKDATIREVHHRVKNNLQTIASLLRLQSRRLQSKEAVAALEESVMRIGSIALVHETLSAAPSDVAEFGDIARRIARMVSDGLVDPERSIDIKVSGSTGPLGAELATPLAVTVTELIQNAMEHAFPDGRSGIVVIELLRTDSAVQVVVRDDGVGMDPSARLKQGSRLGLQIVSSLVQEMEGEMQITTDSGTHIELRLPL